MPRHQRTEAEIEMVKIRVEEYRRFFRYFDSISQGIAWVMKTLKCQAITASVWRMHTGYGIPKRKLEILRDAAKKSRRFKGLYT